MEYPRFLFYGSGEGGYKRFDSANQEIHVGPLAILFGYGVIGFVAFSMFLWRVCRAAAYRGLILVAGVVVISMGQQCYRALSVWIALAAVAGMDRITRFPGDSIPLDREFEGA